MYCLFVIVCFRKDENIKNYGSWTKWNFAVSKTPIQACKSIYRLKISCANMVCFSQILWSVMVRHHFGTFAFVWCVSLKGTFSLVEAYYAAGLGKPNYTLKEYLKFVGSNIFSLIVLRQLPLNEKLRKFSTMNVFDNPIKIFQTC